MTSRGTPRDAPLTRGDLLERCDRALPEHARADAPLVTGHGLAPKDLVEPVTTIGDATRRWEIYRHPARHGGGYVVVFSYHDRTRSKIIATGTLTACRDNVHVDLLGHPPPAAWMPGIVQRAVRRRQARRVEGFTQTPVREMRRAPDVLGELQLAVDDTKPAAR